MANIKDLTAEMLDSYFSQAIKSTAKLHEQIEKGEKIEDSFCEGCKIGKLVSENTEIRRIAEHSVMYMVRGESAPLQKLLGFMFIAGMLYQKEGEEEGVTKETIN